MIRNIILRLLGWNPNIPLGNNHKPFVGCLSHTSKFDAFLLVLFGFSPILNNSYTVMMPQYFKYFSWILRKLNFIPSTRLEDSGNNFVKLTSELLLQKNKKILLISPEGSLIAKKWRSGYFWLAKELNWDIRVCGFDYKNKRISISDPYKINYYSTPKCIEDRLIQRMSFITPLYPKNCYANLTKNKEDQSKIKINYKLIIFTIGILSSPISGIFIKRLSII